jgi:hypothetical protein
MHQFPKADEGELREQCRDTVQEYEESMWVWKEMKDTGDLCTRETNSEEKDELTGEDLLQTLDKILAAASLFASPEAELSSTDWPKRVLRQTILVSSIAAEIESNTDGADWDESCYEECRRLLQIEVTRLRDISENQRAEKIPVLVDWEVQRWITEALEGTTRASKSWETRSPKSACDAQSEAGRGVGTSQMAPARQPGRRDRMYWMPPGRIPSATHS